MMSDQGDFGREFPGYQWKISVEDAPSPALGAQFARDMKRIDVLVTLNNGEHSYEFRTYRFNARENEARCGIRSTTSSKRVSRSVPK